MIFNHNLVTILNTKGTNLFICDQISFRMGTVSRSKYEMDLLIVVIKPLNKVFDSLFKTYFRIVTY